MVLWEIPCLPASRRGTGFSREGGISDDEDGLNVLASSRLKPVSLHQEILWEPGLPAIRTTRSTCNTAFLNKFGPADA
jgi:hypothetical protein